MIDFILLDSPLVYLPLSLIRTLSSARSQRFLCCGPKGKTVHLCHLILRLDGLKKKNATAMTKFGFFFFNLRQKKMMLLNWLQRRREVCENRKEELGVMRN